MKADLRCQECKGYVIYGWQGASCGCTLTKWTWQPHRITAEEFLKEITRPGDNESVGKRLRSKRIQLNVLQAEMAKAMGISQSELSKIETGQRILSANKAQKAAHKLNVSVNWILSGSDNI